MTIYSYIAIRNGKEEVRGKVEADDKRSARAQIKQLNLIVKDIWEDTINNEQKQEVLPTVKLRPLSLKDKIDFASTYQTLAGAGVPVVESLLFMEQESGSDKLRALAKELRRHILAGSTFADTVKRYTNIFGQIFVGLTKAGEDSGEMENTMGRIIELLRKQEAIKGKVIGALTYPAFVVVLAIIVIIVMLVFVFPKFAENFKEQGKELPWVTNACIVAGDFLKDYWYAVIILAVALIVGSIYLMKWEPARKRIDTFALKIPLIGNLLKYGGLSNFLAVLQVAYEAGVPIVNCLSLASLTVENGVIKKGMESAKAKVQGGLHLSQALRSTGIMPKMLLFMIQTGEQSGKLGIMLEQAVKFIDKELDKFVDKMTKAIEPIMLIVLGGIVMFFALALYLPLFGMMQPT
ncbi:type II secretion system F family protein [bacterium]|nr:type II secretion system F family protein [bacterium]